MPAILQQSYYPSLDGFRGLAVLIVLASHFGINRLLRPFHLLFIGETGVAIFFVLSGFLVTTLLLKEKVKTGTISLKRFYIRRALRIMPVAYLFLIILIALKHFYNLKISMLDFSASFLFFKNFPIKNEPYTAHFWSLAVEGQFYLVFPFLLVANLNRYIIIAFSIIIAVPIISIVGYYTPFLNGIPTISFITKVMMYSFWKGPVIILIGSVFAILLFKGIIKLNTKRGYFLSFVLILVAIVISTPTFIFYIKYLAEYLAAILMGLAIVLSLNKHGLLSSILSNVILVRLGIISYSIYIWQELFIGVGAWQPWMQPLHNYPLYLLIIIKLLIVFTIAFVSYYFFELKFLKLKNRYE